MGQFDGEGKDDLSPTGKCDLVSDMPVEQKDTGHCPPQKGEGSAKLLETEAAVKGYVFNETKEEGEERKQFERMTEDAMEDSVEARMEKKFERMMEGRKTFSDLRAPDKPPPWLDKEAARRGREVYLRSLLQHSFGVMDALLMGLCIPNFYQPLVFSRQSLSTKLARKRYMDTGALIFSWYLGDAWESESLPARMIRRVNAMHKSVALKVRPLGLEALAGEASGVLREVGAGEELDQQDLILLDSVKELREEMEMSSSFYDYVNDSVLFSEMDMTMVQGAFVGPFLLFHSHYGFGTCEQELSDFLHLWRVHGYYLGISEENNAIQETVQDTKVLAEIFLERILKPCMLHITPESMYMAKVAFPSLDYHVSTYTNFLLVGLPLPKLWASFTYQQVFRFYWRRFFMEWIAQIPGVRQLLNRLVSNIFHKLVKIYHSRESNKDT